MLSGIAPGRDGVDKQQILECLQRVAEVERSLQAVQAAGAALASVKQTLAQICAAPAPAIPEDQSLGCQSFVTSTRSPDSSPKHLARSSPQLPAGPKRHHEDEIIASMRIRHPLGKSASHPGVMKTGRALKEIAHDKRARIFYPSRVSICGLRLKFYTVRPESPVRVVWDLLGLAFVLYETYAIPFYIAFSTTFSGALLALVSVINVYFMLDVLASFFTGFRLDDGFCEMRVGYIMHKYLRTWFLPDLIVSIPWEWVEMLISLDANFAQLTKMLRLFRITRLLRLFRRDYLPEQMKQVIDANPFLVFITRVAVILFVLYSITHWSACIWYLVGSSSRADTTWVDKMNLRSTSTDEQYMYSLYFTLTTMTTVGYGDITPQNYGEVCFVSVLLLMATVVFATLMGSLTDLIGNLNSEKNTLREKVLMLSRYMYWRAVPSDLFQAVRRHLLYLWETNSDYDAYEEEVKDKLPPVLRQELCYHIYGNILQTVPFFAWTRGYDSVLKEIALCVQQKIWSRGDRLFRVGEPSDQIFVLIYGKVRVSMNESLYALDNFEDPSIKPFERESSPHVTGDALPATPASKQVFVKSLLARTDWISSAPLQQAWVKLQTKDLRRRWAARLIQGKWKVTTQAGWSGSSSKSTHFQTTLVVAPAYFGESCLWQPYEDWLTKEPPVHRYSARCESRCELLCISRREIKTIIERFSPWLPERFQFFQEAFVGAAGAGERFGSDCGPLGDTALQGDSPLVQGDFQEPLVGGQAAAIPSVPVQAPVLPNRVAAVSLPRMPWAATTTQTRSHSPPPGVSSSLSPSSRVAPGQPLYRLHPAGLGSSGRSPQARPATYVWATLRDPLLRSAPPSRPPV